MPAPSSSTTPAPACGELRSWAQRQVYLATTTYSSGKTPSHRRPHTHKPSLSIRLPLLPLGPVLVASPVARWVTSKPSGHRSPRTSRFDSPSSAHKRSEERRV